MTTYLLLDCHYLCYRNHYALRNLSHNGESTGAIYGFFRDLIIFKDLFDTDRFIFCFDLGKNKRTELFPLYKSTRKKEWTVEQQEEHHVIHRQIEDLRTEHLPRLGFQNILFQPGYEADDIITSVVKNSLTENDDAIIVSSDGDLLQLLSHNIILYNPAKKKCTNRKSFVKQWGIEPCFWGDVKAMAGCVSDGIPGIEGIGEGTASQWFAGKLKMGKKMRKIENGLDIYAENVKLTKLPFLGVEKFRLKEDKIDKNEWQKLMKEMGMDTIRNVSL